MADTLRLTLPPDCEQLADDAFLSLWKLREKLTLAHENALACRADEAIEALERICRGPRS